MLAQSFHESLELIEAGHDVKRQVVLSWREADDGPFTLPSARIPLPITAEADDTRTPHHRLRIGRIPHEFHDRQTVVAAIRSRISISLSSVGLVFSSDIGRSPFSTMPLVTAARNIESDTGH